MNMPLSSSLPLVDIARGSRTYLHTTDLIRAAPVNAEDATFQLRFRSVVKSPGRWTRRANASVDARARVELRIDGAKGPRYYDFLCPDEGGPLRRVPDWPFTFRPDRFRLEGSALSGPLEHGADFSQQLIEAGRHHLALLFPDQKWLVYEYSGVPACLNPIPSGSTLRLNLIRGRRQVHVFRYTSDLGIDGLLKVTPVS